MRNESSRQQDGTGCHASGLRPGIDSLVALTGYLNVIFGDPPAGAGKPMIVVELAVRPGRTVILSADSARAAALDDARRFNGRRVQALGRFLCGDSTTFWAVELKTSAEQR